jgi:hypothetical protein
MSADVTRRDDASLGTVYSEPWYVETKGEMTQR